MMIKSYVQAGNEVRDMALRTGLSTTALSELKYAAEMTGVSLGDIEIGIKKMSKSLVEATQGSKQYVDAFALIGLKAEELISLSPEQQFDKIASAIAALESPTLRASAAQDLLGKSGTALLPLFSEGTEGLEALKKKAHELGIVFDQEAADKADALEDAITTLKGSFTGIGNTIAGTLAPAITGLVEKITGVVAKVKEWMTAHPGLSGAILKVVTAMGLLMTAIGPMLIVLPTLVASLKMLGLAKMALLGPIGLVTAALAGLAIGYLSVQDAQDKAAEAARRYDEIAGRFHEKLQKLATAAGLTSGEFDALTKKYGENDVALAMAIKRGQEGVTLQAAMAAVGKENRAALEAQEKALRDKANAEMKALQASEAAKAQAEAIITVRRQLTDEIQKGTLKEYDYQKWALGAAYEERKATIAKEVTDEKAKGELLTQAKISYNAQLAALEKQHRDQDLQARIEFAQLIYDQEAQQTLDRIAALQAFTAQKQTITDAINQMTMSELTYKLWAVDQERIAEETRITQSKELTAAQKEEALALLESYYKKKKKLAEDDAKGWTELMQNTMLAIRNTFGSFLSNTLDAFQRWGEGGGNVLKVFGEAFKNMVGDAIGAIKSLVVEQMIAAVKIVYAKQIESIASVIASVMMSIPFPLNLILVGGAITAVSRLFSAIKFGEGGIVDRPTLAMIGEKGPEAVIPLDRPGALAMAGGGVILRQSNYFYGNIQNAGDIDEISRCLAARTIQAISKGRRL